MPYFDLATLVPKKYFSLPKFFISNSTSPSSSSSSFLSMSLIDSYGDGIIKGVGSRVDDSLVLDGNSENVCAMGGTSLCMVDSS